MARPKPATLFAALESSDGSQVYAEKALAVAAGDWQRLDFSSDPGTAQPMRLAIRLKLKEPGSPYGRPCVPASPASGGASRGCRCVAMSPKALIDQGVTVLRYGGSMVNDPGYQLEEDDRAARSPPAVFAAPGIPTLPTAGAFADFMEFCEAAGF